VPGGRFWPSGFRPFGGASRVRLRHDRVHGLGHPSDALVYLLEGEAEVVISGKPFRLKGGEMVVMPANDPHALKAITRFKMVLTMIRS
jgi:quercetin dioxygenase-like cupin family protein